MKNFYYSWIGMYEKAQIGYITAQKEADSLGMVHQQSMAWFFSTWFYFLIDHREMLKENMVQWLDHSTRIVIRQYGLDQSESLLLRGLMDIRNGDIDTAESRLNQWADIQQKNAYIDIMLQYHHDLLEIEVLLARDKINEAIRVGRNLEPPALPRIHVSLLTDHIIPVPKDGLARAFYAKGDMDRAIAEYERLVTFDPKDPSKFLIDPRDHYKLAKLYEERGSVQRAIEEFEKFLDIWKNADEGLPELVDARGRLALLKEVKVK